MKRWAKGFISAVAMILLGGCITTQPYNPFKVPREEMVSRVKKVALLPVSIPEGFEDPEPVKTKFDALIEAKMQELGFQTISTKDTEEIWKNMKEQLGGYFDPMTGKVNEEKLKAAKEHTRREINTRFNADSVLLPSIMVFVVPFRGGTASWHGTSESMSATGGWKSVLDGSASSSGGVKALSLVIGIEDANGVEMYSNAGGIQLLAKLAWGSFTDVPRSELFTNDEKAAAAVNFALKPLINQPEQIVAPAKQ